MTWPVALNAGHRLLRQRGLSKPGANARGPNQCAVKFTSAADEYTALVFLFSNCVSRAMFELVKYRGWIVFAVVSVVGCGGRAERNDSHPNEADSGTFPCGDAICGPMQICVYPPACLGFPPPDGGTCPTDTTYSQDAGACLAITPSCVSPGAAAQGTLDCSGGDGGAVCTAVGLPIPIGCSRTCHTNCV
jgi:hypothetical protein